MDSISSVPLRVRDDLPRILATYAVITSENPANTQYPSGYTEGKWKPIGTKDLKEIKQTVVSYGMHSTICYEDGKHMASN